MATHPQQPFEVEDYERWKAGHEEIIERKAAGKTSQKVYRSVEEANTITVLLV
jgi:hypothetical protein